MSSTRISTVPPPGRAARCRLGALAALLLIAGGTAAGAGSGHGGGLPEGAVGLDVSARGDIVDALIAYHHHGVYRLEHRRSADGGRSWGEGVEIPTTDRAPAAPHRGMDAQIAAHGDRVVALWTIPGSSAWGSGPLTTALSSDGGRTWSAGPNPADDGSDDGHGFSDLAFDAAGRLHAVWLDGRDGSQGLRWARSDDAGRSWTANVTIDSPICECCWNKVVPREGGTAYVLYRDVEPRDMALAATPDAGATWSRLGPTEAFDWRIDGCPHVGGGLAVTASERGEELHVLSWTGKSEVAGLYLETSGDGGRSWREPYPLAGAGAQHGDLAARGEILAVAWDEIVSGSRVVFAATSADAGASWTPRLRFSADGAKASHPLVVAVGDDFVVLWTESTEGSPAVWRAVRLREAVAAGR